MNDWLRDLSLVAGSSRYGHDLLLYEGIVPHGRVRLEGVVSDPALQLVQVEHFAGTNLVQIKVVPVRRGRFFCHLDLFRGQNELVVGAFDASGRVQARRVIYRSRLREWSEVFLVALAVALILRALLVQAFAIPPASTSMAPALQEGDSTLIDKARYLFEDPRRGDIVVFDLPDRRFDGPSQAGAPGAAAGDAPAEAPRAARRPTSVLATHQVEHFLVKRIVGLPGEQVEVRGNAVWIDGQPLPEPYRQPATDEPDAAPEGEPLRLEAGQYFVLGDNRLNSEDSRVWGPVGRDRLVGRVFFRYWPPQRGGRVH